MKSRSRNFRIAPWRERNGRLSFLKATVFVCLFLPGVWTILAYPIGQLGGHPLMEAIHQTGLWAIRFLFIALTITPLRQSLQWQRLLLVRRMLGVTAFAYAATHLSLYIADQSFNLLTVASEILRRIYLTIGFIALSSLAVLAATSTDAMIKRLGAQNWRRLHRIVYGIGVLASVHFFLQVKANVYEPIVMFGCLAWLFGFRVLSALRGANRKVGIPVLLGLSVTAGVLTACGEAGYFWLKLGVDPLRVLTANLTLATGLRPAWIVFGAGLLFTVAAALRGIIQRLQTRGRIPQGRASSEAAITAAPKDR